MGPEKGKGLCQGHSEVSEEPGLEPGPRDPPGQGTFYFLPGCVPSNPKSAHLLLQISPLSTTPRMEYLLCGLQPHTPPPYGKQSFPDINQGSANSFCKRSDTILGFAGHKVIRSLLQMLDNVVA